MKGAIHFLDCSTKDLGINYDQLKLFFLQTKCKINRKKEMYKFGIQKNNKSNYCHPRFWISSQNR